MDNGVTTEELEAAIKVGVDAGLLPTDADTATYLFTWATVEDMIKAALRVRGGV